MNIFAKTLAAIAAGALLATSALAQSAASLVVPIENEPAPRLFVEPPLPGPLAGRVAFIPYRVENLRIMPVGGAAARNISPRVGHLHITVDDFPGSGRTMARATPSSWLTCRAASTRC